MRDPIASVSVISGMSPDTWDISIHESQVVNGEDHQRSSLRLVCAEDGMTFGSATRRRSLKPISSGWKSLAWTKPTEECLEGSDIERQGAKVGAAKQQNLQPGDGLSRPSPTPTASPDPRDSSPSTRAAKPSIAEDESQTQPTSQGAMGAECGPVGNGEAEDISNRPRRNLEVGRTSGSTSQLETDATPNVGIDTAATATNKGSGSSLTTLLGRESNDLWAKITSRQENEGLLDASHISLPMTQADHNSSLRQVRALSDIAVAKVSEDGAKSRGETVNVQGEVGEEGGTAPLMSLCSRGKGLPVAQFAASGGSKSRKILRYKADGGILVLSGARPPYFKTKIAVIDVDRVDAKWCCVVVHVKDRPPVRLEVDSCATAMALRAGILAASSARLRYQESGASPLSSRSRHRRDRSESSDLGLASVRPGHAASKVYDPDAALSVAARLAQELEEERASASGSSHSTEAPQPADVLRRRSLGHATKPLPRASIIKRSLSMSSVVKDKVASEEDEERAPSQPSAQGTTHKSAGEKPAKTEAALRRLRAATEGRGMAALKKYSNGKGRSRVMVRCRMEAGTIGWAHVLPPFTRRNVPAQDLIGASRSCKEVTINFRDREPAVFELDRLTDALILEQGFVCLARLIKHAL